MSVTIDGQRYYRTAEVCRMVGISRNTLFRWVKEGSVSIVEHRDCRGWRLFTQAQVNAINKKMRSVVTIHLQKQAKGSSLSGRLGLTAWKSPEGTAGKTEGAGLTARRGLAAHG